MMLNRENYEAFFLLYIDNELSAEERRAVELFIAQHPDLAPELDQLAGVILPEETFAFPGREILYRNDETESLLLSYIDKELATEEAKTLEEKLLASPALQQQLVQLQNAVLPMENIVFENKSVLYRHDKKRIAYLFPGSIAVAAAIMGLLITGWWLLQPSTPENSPVAVTKGSEPLQDSSPEAAANKNESRQPLLANSSAVKEEAAKTVTATSGDSPVKTATAATTAGPVKGITSLPAVIATVKSVVVESNIQTASLPEKPVVTEETVARPTALIAAATPSTTTATEKSAVATTKDIVYKELDTSDEAEPVYVGTIALNKNKLTGFIKKAGRLLGGKAKSPEEQ